MPKEYREISFTFEEVGEAMLDHAMVQAPELTLGPPRDIKLLSGESSGLSVVFGEEEMRFTPLEITAALIRLAKKIGVPVARKARKALAPGNGVITLKLWLPDPDQ